MLLLLMSLTLQTSRASVRRVPRSQSLLLPQGQQQTSGVQAPEGGRGSPGRKDKNQGQALASSSSC